MSKLIALLLLLIPSVEGACGTSKDCKDFVDDVGKPSICVSTITNRVGITEIEQCTPQIVCSGLSSGHCPLFGAKKYAGITSVCALFEPGNCLGDKSVDLDKDQRVECLNFVHDKTIYPMIYRCVDHEKFVEDQTGFNATSAIMEACKSNNTEGVCNGHGTCVPKSPLSMEYECLCYPGYSKENNCYNATSNTCIIPEQCGTQGKCDMIRHQCQCNDGYRGNQCSKCDPKVKGNCNDHGKCLKNGTCTCHHNYTGTFCEIPPKGKEKGTNNLDNAQATTASAAAFSLTFLCWGFVQIVTFF